MPKPFNWTEEGIALLGTAPDQVVADMVGTSPPTVSRKRAELGIPPFGRAGAPIDWTKTKIALLGTAPDGVVADRLGISKWSVLGKRIELGIPAYSAES